MVLREHQDVRAKLGEVGLQSNNALNCVDEEQFRVDNDMSAVYKYSHRNFREIQLFSDSYCHGFDFSARLSEMRAGFVGFERMLLQWIFS